jgi:acyl dehydratase
LEHRYFDDPALGDRFVSPVWLGPVRPGDTLHTKAEVVALRASSSKPDRGVVHLKSRGVNQRSETVLSSIGTNMLPRRPA